MAYLVLEMIYNIIRQQVSFLLQYLQAVVLLVMAGKTYQLAHLVITDRYRIIKVVQYLRMLEQTIQTFEDLYLPAVT